MNNSNKPHNQRSRRNNQIFALLMVLTQVTCSVIYGVMGSIDAALLNISDVISMVALALLVTAGFGLVVSYLKKLVWSGLGFTFLITALSLELYPLINNFWAETHIHSTTSYLTWSQHAFKILLTNSEQSHDRLCGNTLSNGFKCALANVVAFSSILGRAGALECWIVIIMGTIGFELNKVIILNLANDPFGTYFIFTFGGFMGMALGVILKICREKLDNGCSTSKNSFNTSYYFSSTLALFGSLIIFLLFPFLAYNVQNTHSFNTFYLTTGPISLILGMGASIIGALCVSIFINGNLIIRDIVNAPIAGGIVVGSASFFISNPVYSLVAGTTAGVVQTLIQNCIERPHLQSKSVISTISWSLFGVQGIIGGAFASGYHQIILSNSNNLTFSPSTIHQNPGYQLLAAVISAGIGLGFGIIAGLLILLVSSQKGTEHFTDRTYWNSDDGITGKARRSDKIERSMKHSPPKPIQVRIEGENKEVEKEGEQYVIKQKQVRIQYSEVVPFEISTPNFEMSFSEASKIDISHAYL